MYQKVCFYIDSMYEHGKGFPDRTARIAFQDEAKRLLRCAGWEIIPGLGCEGDYAVKGKQSLRLHPAEFSGVILAEEVGRVRNALRVARSFHLRSIGRSATSSN
jgi:hypothetical protein